MSRRFWNKAIASLTAFAFVAVLALGATAQEKKAEAKGAAEKKVEAKKEVAKEAAVKERAKPKGLLPDYYGEVVSPDQREKIYAIQAKYAAEIDRLQEELKALKEKQVAEVAAVLTPEQKEKVAKIAAEAKAKREKTAEEKKAGAAKEADKPATK